MRQSPRPLGGPIRLLVTVLFATVFVGLGWLLWIAGRRRIDRYARAMLEASGSADRGDDPDPA